MNEFYQSRLTETNDPLWAIAIELARIVDALEPSDDRNSLHSHIERIADFASEVASSLEPIGEKIDTLGTDLSTGLRAIDSDLEALDTTLSDGVP